MMERGCSHTRTVIVKIKVVLTYEISTGRFSVVPDNHYQQYHTAEEHH